jgi:hypothetical protein
MYISETMMANPAADLRGKGKYRSRMANQTPPVALRRKSGFLVAIL